MVTGKIFIGDSRSMREVEQGSVDLVVTSPPYWHIKNYGKDGQIGYGQTLHQYLRDLCRVWSECSRVLRDGGRLCVNIGDQFARTTIYGRYKVIPLHAELIAQCEQLGLDFMGSIVWRKRTTMNTTGGATVMGSFPYPPNGIVEIDYEFIQIFKKPGGGKAAAPEVKRASRLSAKQWKEYFLGHWSFGGARQVGHEAMFPDELPRRLVRMFTFKGDTVLDPFLGSGTTMRVALELGRNAVGYEINDGFLDGIGRPREVQILRRQPGMIRLPPLEYIPRIRDAKPPKDPDKHARRGPVLHRVTDIVDARTLKIESGQKVRLMGIRIGEKAEALRYLKQRVLRKEVSLDPEPDLRKRSVTAYVRLKNRIFVNAYLIKAGLASPDLAARHRLADKFRALGAARGKR